LLQNRITKAASEVAALRGEVAALRGEVAALRNEFAQSTELVDAMGRPNLGPISLRTRNERIVTWNVKNFGYELARSLATQHNNRRGRPTNLAVTSRAACQADIEAPWFAHWCAQLKVPVVYHRKLWEYCFLLQSIHDENLLVPGKKGLGFACGQEPIPSYLASLGILITATDLTPEEVVGKGWAQTNEHAHSVDVLWHRHLIERDHFDRAVSFQYVNANEIPRTLVDYDFCWSICALEHLGSIENGLAFIENSLDVLRPGGVAVHTTEFNVDNEGPTIDNWITVLFQRKHIELIVDRLTKKGHYVAPLNFDFGDGPLDNFIDLPPYQWNRIFNHPHSAVQQEHPSHLKLSIDGFACTCFGLVIRKKN
jgi:2-polyprenyl-3-methyl-5-hydroxy-6-metoxy-1,4-benzoquinol methylase